MPPTTAQILSLAGQAGDLIEFTAQDVPVRVIPVGRPDGLRAGT